MCVQCVLAVLNGLSTERVRRRIQPSLHCSYPISSFAWRSALPHDVSAQAQRCGGRHLVLGCIGIRHLLARRLDVWNMWDPGCRLACWVAGRHVNVASFNATTYLISIVHRAPAIPPSFAHTGPAARLDWWCSSTRRTSSVGSRECPRTPASHVHRNDRTRDEPLSLRVQATSITK